MDSARWDHVELRADDIVVAVPAKCGTTWIQAICALLVFGTARLPAGIDELSPWVELRLRPQEEMAAHVAAQGHRRFLKSHSPLDGLPYDERVTYICVGRDPRDVALSLDHHMANIDVARIAEFQAEMYGAAGTWQVGNGRRQGESAAVERIWNWIDSDDPVLGMPAMLHHLATFWERRGDPNVVLLHYADLRADPEGQMRALADRLGIAIEESRWPELVHAAGFEQMRGNADVFAPENFIWRNKAEFFHRGTSGQWRELLDASDLRGYAERVRRLADPELSAWLHRGSLH